MVDIALFFQVLVWLLITVIFWRSSRSSIFHPIAFYLVFHGIVFVVRPLLVQYTNFDAVWHYMGFYPTDEEFVRALAISSLGLLVFVAGCYLGALKSKKLIFSGPTIVFSTNENRAFYIMFLLILPAFVYSVIVLAGGIEGELVGETFIMTSVSGYIYDSQSLMIPLLALFLLKKGFNLYSLVPITAYFGFRAYVGWGRWGIILSGISFVLVYCWSHRRIHIPKFIFVAVPIIYVGFAILGANRDVFKEFLSGQPLESVVLDKSTTFQEKFDTLDFANFDYLTYIAAVVPTQTGTYNYGIGWLQIFTEPIPRQLWPNKPIGAPSFFVLSDYGNFISLTYSLPGNGWMDGGWFGVIILCSLCGFGLGRFYKWFTWNEGSKVSALIYIMAISMIFQLFRDGNISILKFWLFIIPPIYFWNLIVKVFDNQSGHSPAKLQSLI